MVKFLKFAAVAMLSVGLMAPAWSQDWPNRPIRLIVPYGGGSGPDAALRPVAEQLSKILGQSVVVEDAPSAGGILGSQMLAKAKPDGYTFGFGNNITLAVNKSFYDKLPYDPAKDFEPVGLLFSNAYMLVAAPGFKPNTVQDLIAYARANPGKVNFASGTGVGSGSHLTGEMLKSVAKVDLTHVPYKTGAQAMSDVVSGRVEIMFGNVSGVQQFVSNGTIKVLAVTSAKRLTQYPNVPTMAESGFPGFEALAWGGIIAPAGTPKAVIQRLNAAIAESLKTPEVIRTDATMSPEPLPSSPEVFAQFIDKESAKWAELVRVSGAKAN